MINKTQKVESLKKVTSFIAFQNVGGLFWSCILCVILAVGCTPQEPLPLKMEVTQIEVFSVNVENETSALLTITDSDQISEIIAELNRLQKTHFEDPEPPADKYKIIMRDNKDREVVFYYADRVQYGGKIYTEKSADKGIVWRTTERLAELLLGDKRGPLQY